MLFGVDEPAARGAMPHYFHVLDGEEKAHFLRCASLTKKVESARLMRASCLFCERRCGVDRTEGEKGFCRVLEPRVASQFIHVGEEPEIVPSHTIFFSGCTFTCCFCQNVDISQHAKAGACIQAGDLAKTIESTAALNVNWVGGDPTPNLDYVLEVLTHVKRSIPQIWNSNMYLTEESMALLEGVVDLYLTDFKYGSNECGKLSGVEDYFDIISRNHLLAEKQDADLLVRHLVLPGHLECCSKPVLDWISKNLKHPRVNVMGQYRPEWKAHQDPTIHRRLEPTEYREARKYAEELGLSLTR